MEKEVWKQFTGEMSNPNQLIREMSKPNQSTSEIKRWQGKLVLLLTSVSHGEP